MVAMGQNFFWAAQDRIPAYTSGNLTPTLNVDMRDAAVTANALLNTSSSFGTREYCDFLLFNGHGLYESYFLGGYPSYRYVNHNQLNLGVGYVRFFLANSCNSFMSAEGPAAHWAPAFKGLKAMLGFKSLMWDNSQSWNLFYDFWNGWTFQNKSLLNAFFDAEADYGYKHIYPTKGLEPGCLSAPVPEFTVDHCRLSFKYVSGWAPATYGTGYYYSRKIGNPEY
jgi:hypothetical protein